MTREEAIRIIETVFQDEYVYKYYDSITHQALNMAIEALSQPNYETDTEVRLAVTNRKKEKVILCDAYGEVEYYPIEALSADVEIPSDKTVVHIETYRRLYEKYVGLKNNAVKVVKCKNCRHRSYDKYNDCYMCDRHEYGESFEDDDYCSWGERAEQTEEYEHATLVDIKEPLKVAVVRCKDCRWYEQKQKNLPYNVSKRYCNRSCVLATKENDFCSYGERREP